MKKHIANIVTSIRILFSVCMLLSSVFSPLFYCTYLLCGFTDMIDGTIARKTNSATSFGSHLDSIADLIFLTAASIKILPAIYIPGWIWFSILIVFIIKIAAVLYRYIFMKQFPKDKVAIVSPDGIRVSEQADYEEIETKFKQVMKDETENL